MFNHLEGSMISEDDVFFLAFWSMLVDSDVPIFSGKKIS